LRIARSVAQFARKSQTKINKLAHDNGIANESDAQWNL
jgi:hypothetical protein